MIIQFSKYQGAGNDFIIIDNRAGKVALNKAQIAGLCDRHFGIGADGLMLLQNETGYDFRMVYYNADGGESTMCGNGGRCMAAFAKELGLAGKKVNFVAIDGPHSAEIEPDGTIHLHMKDVADIRVFETYTLLNTGSPHYVHTVNNVQYVDVYHEGKAIRNRPEFMPDGINVNFVEHTEDGLWVRTFERGVEDETLSCGTGVTAAAIAGTGGATGTYAIGVNTPGGILKVSFTKDTPASAKYVVLSGPAKFVFAGHIELA